MTFKNQLNDTGEGLPFDEESGKLPDDHPVKNLYGAHAAALVSPQLLNTEHRKILTEFPWYYRVRNLLVKSPIYDRSAVANSATSVDFSFMVRNPDGAKTGSSTRKASSAPDGSTDDESEESSSEDGTKARKKAVAAPPKAASGTHSAAAIKPLKPKRPTHIEALNAGLERDAAQRQTFLETAMKAKQDAAERKVEKKQDLQMKMLQMKLESKERREREQREHEYRMAQVRLGIPMSSTAPLPTSTPSLGHFVPPSPSITSTLSFDSYSPLVGTDMFTFDNMTALPLPSSSSSSAPSSAASTPSSSYSSLVHNHTTSQCDA